MTREEIDSWFNTLDDGLVQWDVNVTIQVGGADTASAPNFHFCQRGQDYAYVVPSTVKGDKLEAAVPNILLQHHYPIIVFLYYTDASGEQRSKYQFQIPVSPREIPMEYVYVENIGYEDWVKMTEEAKAIIDASENLDERLKKAQELLDQMDEDVQQAQTAEQSASQHEQGAKQALTDTQAALEEVKKNATAAAGNATAADGSATKAKADADRAAEEAAAALASKTASAESQAAAKKSEEDAAKHLADALAAKEGAEAAKDGADTALEEATQKAEEASGYADTAKQYSGNPAIPQNGTWWIWDADQGEYVDTGKRAVLKPDIVYGSVELMEQDKSQEIPTLAIISTEINKEDNAKLFVWEGVEDYRLDPNDYSKKLRDGTESDVANTKYAGNAMSAIPLCWVKRYQEGDYQYVIFCETQYDEGYKAYAHTRADGSVSHVAYHSIYKGSMVESTLRSLSGQYPQSLTTAEAERTAAQKNGTGWEIRTWSLQCLIADLCTLISKTMYSQEAFGNGNMNGYVNDAAQHYGFCQCGSLDKMGQFFGYSDNNKQVKVFHIEGFWADRWDRLVGLIYRNGVYLAKMTPEGTGYNLTGDGYTPIGTGIINTAASGSGWQKETIQTEYGRFPTKELTGSETTYETDFMWWNNTIVSVALAGGSCSDGAGCGARCLAVNSLASGSAWVFGSSLSCIGPS